MHIIRIAIMSIHATNPSFSYMHINSLAQSATDDALHDLSYRWSKIDHLKNDRPGDSV